MRTAETNRELVEIIKYRADIYLGGGSRDSRVLEAMREVDRAAFVPAGSQWAAYFDEPVDIGFGQTCSQPSMVAFMLDKLSLRPGLSMLEIGSGSGYAAAIAALLCRPGGRVLAVEIRPELSSRSRASCATAGPRFGPPLTDSIEFLAADGSAGVAERAPFDRILVSAGARRPSFREEILVAQLAPDGVLVYPEERGSLYRVERRHGGLVRDRWHGVAFVPLRGRNA